MGSSTQTVSAGDVARYIVNFFQECEDPVTNLKLQKLLYYVQGWHLALHGEPAFEDDFQAWVHGPVVPKVFQDYKANRWNPIVAESSKVELPPLLKAHVDEVMEVYGTESGWSLELRTHREAPWQDARGTLPSDEPSTALISKKAMLAFFKKLDQHEQNQENLVA